MGQLSPIIFFDEDGSKAIHPTVLEVIGARERCGEELFLPPGNIEADMAKGCFEIMIRGTRNESRKDDYPISSLRFNICSLETSYLPNSKVTDLGSRVSERIPTELQYSCLHWVDHLASSSRERESRTDENEIAKHLADFFETTRSLYWLEVLSLLGRLRRGREMLIRFLEQSNAPVSTPAFTF